MNVSVEFSQITREAGRHTPISALRDVDMDTAITISMALQDNPDVEAVIMIDGSGDRAPAMGLGGRLKAGLLGWLEDVQLARLRPASQQQRPASGRTAPAVG